MKLKYKDFFKNILKEADEHKIYVQQGQQVPKGKKLQTGPRGGQFFIGTAQEKETYSKKKATGRQKEIPSKNQSKMKRPDISGKISDDLENIFPDGIGGQTFDEINKTMTSAGYKHIGKQENGLDVFAHPQNKNKKMGIKFKDGKATPGASFLNKDNSMKDRFEEEPSNKKSDGQTDPRTSKKVETKQIRVKKLLNKSIDDLTNSGHFQKIWYEGDMDEKEIYDQSHDLASEVLDDANIDFEDESYDDLYDEAASNIRSKIKQWIKSQKRKPTK